MSENVVKADRRPGAVATVFEVLTGRVDEVELRVDRMIDRVSAVLRPSDPTPADPPGLDRASTAPLAESLDTLVVRLERVVSRLADATDRVEL